MSSRAAQWWAATPRAQWEQEHGGDGSEEGVLSARHTVGKRMSNGT
jgi:hypothetical protein